jgi:hypothetical protein
MQLLATTYRHGCEYGRRGNNASIILHCFTAHSVIGGENYHCTHLTVRCASLVTLEGGYDKARTPRSQGFRLIRSPLTQPRPGLDAQRDSTGKGGRHGAAFRVISASRPLRHYGVKDGSPSLAHVATTTSTGIDKTSSQGSPSSWPPLSL